MDKIATSAKFKELMKKLCAPPTQDQREPKKPAGKDEPPPSVRKSARDVKQPRRYESPVPQPRPKLPKGTPVVKPVNRTKENASPPPRGSGRPKVTRAEPVQPTSRPRKPDWRKQEEPARCQSDREKPASRSAGVDRPRRAELEEESDSEEDVFESASAPRTPPRGSAFSRVTSRQVDRGSPSKPWGKSHFLQPPPPTSRDPRLRKANQNNTSDRRQFPLNDFESARRDPHPMYSRPEASMRQSRDASMRQPMHSRPPKRQREASVRHNVEPDASYFGSQPYVRLTDITRSREITQRWDNGFRRPQTPPEVQDLVTVEKAKLEAEIKKMIDCPHFTSLEIVYALNSIQNTLVGKMERFCRKREMSESLLLNTLNETMQDASRTDRGRVDAWLDGVGPSGKRPRLEQAYDFSRYY